MANLRSHVARIPSWIGELRGGRTGTVERRNDPVGGDWNMNVLFFPYIGNFIIPTDKLFQRLKPPMRKEHTPWGREELQTNPGIDIELL